MALRLFFVAVFVICAGCGKHPVQTAKGWPVPPALATCIVEEKVKWTNGRWRVVLNCPNEYLMVDYQSGEILDRLTHQEIAEYWRGKK
jgi:hypothetical protein